MSKANGFLKEEDAVSPVIGVILMVAITVILAAVIAAFVFGMGPPEQAPQAALRGSSDTATTDGNAIIKLEHQGGDAVEFASANTKITISGGSADAGTVEYNETSMRFEAGEVMYLYNDGAGANVTETKPTTASDVIATSGDIVNVKVIDVASQQMIADLDVRF